METQATKVIIPMYSPIGSTHGSNKYNYTKGSILLNDTGQAWHHYNNECNCLSKIISMKNQSQMIKVK